MSIISWNSEIINLLLNLKNIMFSEIVGSTHSDDCMSI
jgi:hypothetical protein